MKDNNENILNQYVDKSDVTVHETKEFSDWLCSEDSQGNKEKALLSLWDKTTEDTDKNTDRVLLEVMSRINQRKSRSKTVQMRWFRKVAVAAVLTIVSVGGTLWLSRDNTSSFTIQEIHAPLGQLQDITLPDGTFVTINSGSTILYPSNFSGKNREVHLIGEANFNVYKDPQRPFIVLTKNMSVRALGTEFNVASYQKSVNSCATLLEGSVEVECTLTKEKTILYPGEQVQLDALTNKMTKFLPNVDAVTAWQKGELIFEGASIADILNEVGVKFDKYMQFNPSLFSSDKFSLHFRRHETFDDIMQVLKTVVGDFKYHEKSGVCYIYK